MAGAQKDAKFRDLSSPSSTVHKKFDFSQDVLQDGVVRTRANALSAQRACLLRELKSAVENGHKSVTSRRQTSERLQGAIVSEPVPALREAISSLQSAFAFVANRQEFATREFLEKQALQTLDKYESSSVKPLLELTNDRDARILDALKAADALHDARAKAAGGSLSHGSAQELKAVSALRAAHNADVAWSEHAQLWEFQRVTDVKLVLQQWVLSELSVHCAAVERLSATAALLGVVDPNSAMLSLRQSLLGSTVYSDAATGASGPSSVPAVGVTSTRLQTLAQSGVVPLHPYAYSGPPAPVAVAPTTAVQTRVVELHRTPSTGSFGVKLRAAPSAQDPSRQDIVIDAIDPASLASGLVYVGEVVSLVNGVPHATLASMMAAIGASQSSILLTVVNQQQAPLQAPPVMLPQDRASQSSVTAGPPSSLRLPPASAVVPAPHTVPTPRVSTSSHHGPEYVAGDARVTPPLPLRPVVVMQPGGDVAGTVGPSSEDPRNPQLAYNPAGTSTVRLQPGPSVPPAGPLSAVPAS